MLNRRGVVIFSEEFDREWENRIYAAGLNVLGLHPDPEGVLSPR